MRTVTTTFGMVDGHSHLRSTALQAHAVVGSCLEEALLRMTAMSAIDLEDDAFVAACDLVASGVTGVQVAFHAFQNPDEYLESVSAMIRGIRRSHIRALVVLMLTDQAEYLPLGVPRPNHLSGLLEPNRGMRPQEFPDVVRQAIADHPDVQFGIGPVAPQWASDDLLSILGELADSGLRVHAHCLESERQRDWAGNALERLQRFGLLGPRTSLAHCVWCSNAELDLVAESGAALVTCPESNRLLGSGFPRVQEWSRRGITTAIGMDSATDRPRPVQVAREVLPEEEALIALTTGGSAATGLRTEDDEVEWSDLPQGIVASVRVAGRLVVDAGRLVLHDECEATRSMIDSRMRQDEYDRTQRQSALGSFMAEYLRYIDEVDRGR